MLYPLVFEPIYKEMVWGGTRLASLYGRELRSVHTGESWDISCREQEMGVVSNGIYRGRLFIDVINCDRAGVLGARHAGNADFPLLVKLIDASGFLSVQVHPGDEYARAAENYPFGKNEMWYVLDAPQDGYLILGLKDGVTRGLFEASCRTGVPAVEDCLQKLYVKPGDVVDIPAGLVHALGKGLVIAEIQQNSDITYRVYDFGRRGLNGQPRALHIEKALDVIDFNHVISKEKVKGRVEIQNGLTVTKYIENRYFSVIKYDIAESATECTNPEYFHILTCVGGKADITAKDTVTHVNSGDSVFMPAALGEYTINGSCSLLKSYAV